MRCGIGIAITFLWIGILILKNPEAWGGYLQPWAMDLLPIPIAQAMVGTAVMDLVIGLLLLTDTWVAPVSALAALHLIVVLTVSGVNEATVRDIGLLAGAFSLLADSWKPMMKRIATTRRSTPGRNRGLG